MKTRQVIFEEIKKGNQIAFKQLFDDYYYALKGFSRRFVQQEDVCEDIVQKTFILLYENIHKIKYPEALRSYLFSTVRNQCVNHVKRESRRMSNDLDLAAINDLEWSEEYIIEEEVYSTIYKAIKNLSPQSRRIVLFSMNGLKNQEIAEELEISVNTVKTLKKKSYDKLRKELKSACWTLLLPLI